MKTITLFSLIHQMNILTTIRNVGPNIWRHNWSKASPFLEHDCGYFLVLRFRCCCFLWRWVLRTPTYHLSSCESISYIEMQTLAPIWVTIGLNIYMTFNARYFILSDIFLRDVAKQELAIYNRRIVFLSPIKSSESIKL